MEEDLQMDLQDAEDDSYTPGAHNTLLGAVSELYEKKRVKAPTRKEPSLEVSEFHLSRPDKKRGQIKVAELAKVLNKRASHANISQKLKNAQKRAATLPKPLEKIHQDKINRKAGFEHAKQQLNRWDAIVYKQKVAEQLSFPLKNDTIKIHESSDVSTLFRKPTELEIELAKVLNQPNPFADKDKEKKVNEEEHDYPLTLAEIMEKRKMMAKLRAQQSYQQAKAARHSKIKSKKFHQIQRKARIKEQLREFEELQRKDPEAALKKLEELERTRAEERVSLRHRSTGQWAKNLAVRAKYDKEARIALSEQLSKSRELTVKVGKDQEDDSEKEEEGEEEQNQSRPEEDPNNPWVLKQSKDMEDFVSGYRKYWESQGKEQEKLHNHDTSVKVNSHKEEPSAPIQKDVDKENTKPTSVNNTYIETDEIMSNATSLTVGEKKHTPLKLNEPLIKNSLTVDEYCETSSHDENNKFLSSFNLDDALNENKNKKSSSSKTSKKSLNCSISSKMNCSMGSWIISNKKDKTLTNVSSTGGNKVCRFSNSFEVTESKTAHKILETSNKTNEFNIHIREIDNERPQNRKKTLDELFEEVEDKLQSRVKNKIENIKKKITQKRKIKDESDYSEHEDIPNLEIKKRITPADIDEQLIQESGDKSERRTENNLSKTLKTVVGEIKQTENIDPNKFLKVTPRHLLTQIPDIMTEGEDALDDEENVADNRHLTIAEAFAEDDVVDQFNKEKEEEVMKNSVTNVDLTLPGWGSWAGHNIRPVSRRKRKKFVIKFPKAIPRKDTNRGNVIINEDADKPIKDHQVSEVPFPFTSVEEYEASIRAPLGTTWMPQSAHVKLTLPPVVTKMGTIIAPMDESQLVSKDESSSSNKKKKKKPKAINKKRSNVK